MSGEESIRQRSAWLPDFAGFDLGNSISNHVSSDFGENVDGRWKEEADSYEEGEDSK